METAINMQSVYVTDLVGIAILVIIMVTRGWSLPGRKLESRLMMALLAISMFNCVADIYVFQCDGMPGPGYRRNTDVFKKELGAEKTKDFFDNVFFGTERTVINHDQ